MTHCDFNAVDWKIDKVRLDLTAESNSKIEILTGSVQLIKVLPYLDLFIRLSSYCLFKWKTMGEGGGNRKGLRHILSAYCVYWWIVALCPSQYIGRRNNFALSQGSSMRNYPVIMKYWPAIRWKMIIDVRIAK